MWKPYAQEGTAFPLSAGGHQKIPQAPEDNKNILPAPKFLSSLFPRPCKRLPPSVVRQRTPEAGYLEISFEKLISFTL